MGLVETPAGRPGGGVGEKVWVGGPVGGGTGGPRQAGGPVAPGGGPLGGGTDPETGAGFTGFPWKVGKTGVAGDLRESVPYGDTGT